MATHKSAEKRARQSVKRATRNSAVRNTVRTFEKKVRAAITSGDKKTALSLLSGFNSEVARAAGKGVLHAKAAARKVSRVSAHIAALK